MAELPVSTDQDRGLVYRHAYDLIAKLDEVQPAIRDVRHTSRLVRPADYLRGKALLAQPHAIRVGAVRVCVARLTGRESFASDAGDYYRTIYPNDLALGGLLNQLLRQDLPFAEADLLEIVRPLADAVDSGRDHWTTIYQVPVYSCIRAVQRATGNSAVSHAFASGSNTAKLCA